MKEHVHKVEIHTEIQLLFVHDIASTLKHFKLQSGVIRSHNELKIGLLAIDILVKLLEDCI